MKMLSLLSGFKPPLNAFAVLKAARVVNGFDSLPSQFAEHAPELLLTNQIIPETLIVTVAVSVKPVPFAKV